MPRIKGWTVADSQQRRVSILESLREGLPRSEIARRYRVSASLISGVAAGATATGLELPLHVRSRERRAAILEWLRKGWSISKTARKYRVGESLVRAVAAGATAAGVPLPHVHRWKPHRATEWDWSKPNAALAREHGLSRERVRQIRQKLGRPKVGGRRTGGNGRRK